MNPRHRSPNRRGLLGLGILGLGVAAFGSGRAGVARAQPAPPTFASLSVDVRPLRAKGLGEYADSVGATLQSELAAAFADRMSPGGARLVVRIDAISLRDYAGGESRRFGTGAPSDFLEGEALVLDPRGGVLVRHPQLSAVPASSGGAWYLPDSEDRRVVALARHFAGWLRRDL